MPISGPVPLTITFTDTSTPDVTSWLWEFGDGGTATTQNPSHTYSVAGTYLVTLRATGTHGTAVQTDTVTATTATFVAYTAPVLAIGSSVPNEDPQVMLRISNDGGKTWISETWRSAGRLGEYKHRVRWNRLGQARRRVFEVSVTDSIPWRVLGAYIDAQSQKGKHG